MASIVETSRVASADVASREQSPELQYAAVRHASETLCRPLEIDDYGLQAMADTSPAKWHLAHTTWFFETFLLKPFLRGYEAFNAQFEYLFNSYYQAIGAQYARSQRGWLSRPTVDEVYRYRARVDTAMMALLAEVKPADRAEVAYRTLLGCQHEQQHQELLLTDIKYNFSVNPLRPAYRADLPQSAAMESLPLIWVEYAAGLREIGHAGDDFAFDNETPRHSAYLNSFALSSRLITCGEYFLFLDAGGYSRPELWLADGWRTVCERDWKAPLYWELIDGEWWQFTLSGMRRVNPHEPVCHVSFYEADAYARFADKRLPTEQEWETAASRRSVGGNLYENGYLHPLPASVEEAPVQLFGDTWEWTRSAYAPYPGYRTPSGALGEYNGKFMVNQMVLRGGSCATPGDHMRATYRNFFYPADRWQFSGIRLAEDV